MKKRLTLLINVLTSDKAAIFSGVGFFLLVQAFNVNVFCESNS